MKKVLKTAELYEYLRSDDFGNALEGRLGKAEGEWGEIEPRLEPLKSQRDRLVKAWFSRASAANCTSVVRLPATPSARRS